MVECKSQASFTARRLVGQIRTIDQRARSSTLARKVVTTARQRHLHRATNAGGGSNLTSGGSGRGSHRRRVFKYTFTPTQLTDHHQYEAADQQVVDEDHGQEHEICDRSTGKYLERIGRPIKLV